jgi:hypothetical protein
MMVADATACHDRTGWDGNYYPAEMIHRHELISLQNEFATIVQTDELLDRG